MSGDSDSEQRATVSSQLSVKKPRRSQSILAVLARPFEKPSQSTSRRSDDVCSSPFRRLMLSWGGKRQSRPESSFSLSLTRSLTAQAKNIVVLLVTYRTICWGVGCWSSEDGIVIVGRRKRGWWCGKSRGERRLGQRIGPEAKGRRGAKQFDEAQPKAR